MEFQQVKKFCKYAGSGVLCPDNYKHCNADYCPLAIQNIIDEQMCDRYCPIIDQYRNDIRRFKTDYINANEARKQLDEAYRNMLLKYDAVKTELAQNLNNAFHVFNDSWFDLNDKLQTTLKRLEP